MFIKILLYKENIISIKYNKHMVLLLVLFLLFISVFYCIIEFKWINTFGTKIIGNENIYWSILETSYWVFCIICLIKLFFGINNKSKVRYKHDTINNTSNILNGIIEDEKKLKMTLYFVSFLISSIIFLLLSLLNKEKSLSLIKEIIPFIK